MRLPRSLDEVRGLRAARWIRESTDRQAEKYGPDAQREQQDRAIERYGLIDSGLVWQVAHSGRTIAGTPEFAAMLAAAGSGYDVLLVGYVSRFARDLRTAVNARHDLHQAGAALLFCDERVLSSDESAWETWAREAVEAEAYQRRLARRVAEGYEAKFRRRRDPGGNPPLGFRRVGGIMEPDPRRVSFAVGLFIRYASGSVSLTDLEAESGVDREALKVMLRNPVYNGWVRRHPRGPDARTEPAAWRDDPPVSDELWARVQDVRADRDTGGGRASPHHVHLLQGRIVCACGTRIRAEGTIREGRRRYRHPDRCPEWPRSTRPAHVFEAPIGAQVEQMRLGAAMLANLRRLAGATPPPDGLHRRRVQRDLDDLARRHARRLVDTPAYLAEHDRLARLLGEAAPPPAPVVDPDRAVAWLRDLRRAWRHGGEGERRDLVRAIYRRVTATGSGVVEVEPTPDAERHGIALALPQRVVLVRPEGFKPPSNITVRIAVRGHDDWLRALRTA